MAQEPQSVKNHTRFDPAFHFFLAPLALFFVIGTIVRLVRHPAWESALHVLVAIWALVAVFLIRGYSLKVQDRVIRLEERVRLKDFLPPSLQGRIGELTEDQLVGLRFAQPQRRLGGRRAGQDQAGERRGGASAAKPHYPTYCEHGHPPRHLAGKKASV